MPEIKFQHVVSFSTEDNAHPAENLLKPGGYRKWKTAGTGEKQATVVLQFEKSSKIHALDIGNEGSAFIEILAGRSSAGESDYKVILVASAFMNPLESRGNQNMNRVRLFEKDKLSQTAVDEKWDRVKIVCTQPFNKNTQYGLSFITIYSEEDTDKKDGSGVNSSPKVFGGFNLRETDNSDGIKTGTLFAKRKEIKESPSLTGAAAVRAAAKIADVSLPVRKDDLPPPPCLKSHPSSSERPFMRQSSGQPSSSSCLAKGKPAADTPHTLKRKHSSDSPASSSKRTNSESVYDSSSAASLKPQKLKKSKTFNKLMHKVQFVMSGYKNPKRAELRDKAIEMGGQYLSDWSSSCTHLICAFVNTPKFLAVKGKGRIVSEKWIIDCYSQKKLLPWRKYRLPQSGSPAQESESSSEESIPSSPVKHGNSCDDSDTEDEIRHVEILKRGKGSLRIKNPAKPLAEPVENDGPYGASTDEDTEDELMEVRNDGNNELPVLLNIFANKNFLLYGGSLSQYERSILNRFIVAYDGHIEEYMRDTVSYVITKENWDENFNKALADNEHIHFVKPDWIYECDKSQKLLPYQPYLITPDT